MSWENEYRKLLRRVRASVASRVPAHAVEDLAAEAIARAFYRKAPVAECHELEHLSCHIAKDLCVDWYRREDRQSELLQVWTMVGGGHGLARAHRRLAAVRRLLMRCRPGMTELQRQMTEHILEARYSSVTALAMALGVPCSRVNTMILSLAKRVRSEARPPIGSAGRRAGLAHEAPAPSRELAHR